MKYDICVVSFSNIRFDGRTKNLIDALISLEKKIIVFSLTDNIDTKNKYEHISIEVPQNRRMFVRWLTFTSSVKNYIRDIDYGIYWACDLYSLASMGIEDGKIVYDSREIYSQLSTLYNSLLRQKILSLIENHYIKRVDILITSGSRDTEYMKVRYKLKNDCYELYNYPAKQEYKQSNIIRDRLNIDAEKIILLYQGVILQGRGLKPIMDAIKNEIKYVLVILGEGEYKKELIRYSEKLGINKQIYFAGNINYDELHTWTCSADIGLCNIEPISFSYKLALPNKLFEYMLAELPILATALPALAEIVNGTNCGVLIPVENDSSAIISALTTICLNKEQLKENIRLHKYNFVYETQYNTIEAIEKSMTNRQKVKIKMFNKNDKK